MYWVLAEFALMTSMKSTAECKATLNAEIRDEQTFQYAGGKSEFETAEK